MQRVALLPLLVLALAASSSALELTGENYETVATGKNVFLQFYSPS